MKIRGLPLITLFCAGLLAACTQSTEPPPLGAPAAPQAAQAKGGQPAPAAAQGTQAKVGQPAPEFSLPDLDGKVVKLSDYRGKTVVLEWFNAGCPFVRQSHTKGGLKGMAARVTATGVVWLAINSSAPGKQGHGKEFNANGKAEFTMDYPILLDENGQVGKLYGAKRTPHMYVIDPKGTLVYAGAIDSTQGGEPEPDDKVTNYVEVALTEIAAGKPVTTPETEAFGCSVKY